MEEQMRLQMVELEIASDLDSVDTIPARHLGLIAELEAVAILYDIDFWGLV